MVRFSGRSNARSPLQRTLALATNNQQLATGNWQLATGNWQLSY
jgi:hypothetical protein